MAANFEAPILIIVNQFSDHKPKIVLNKEWFENEVFSVATPIK